MISHIRLSKSLNWLIPYLKIAAKLIPNIDSLVRITARKPNKYRRQHVHAVLTVHHDEDDVVSISLNTHHVDYKLKGQLRIELKLKPYSRIDLLCNVAHELAHLQQLGLDENSALDHTPEHKILENNLTKIFMLHLAETGYVSEEDELK